jgi:predicted restriction endonuclease
MKKLIKEIPELRGKEANKFARKMLEKEKVYKPTSIDDAINELQEFLESDLWSKLNDEEINGKCFTREDKFKNEGELWEYLDEHFNILREEIKRLKKKFVEEKKH